MPENRCDIIIPVYNALNYVNACIESIIKYTEYPYKIIIVDDKSDDYVRERLKEHEQKHSFIKVILNDENLGFVKTCNRGIKESSAKYVALLNSDTYVTQNWLSRMVKCAQSDPKIGVLNPIGNMAVNISVQMPPGYNIFTMSDKIFEISKRTYPDIVTAVGFCFMIKRELIDKIGGFDEIYGAGYCEESDYCMKAINAGYRVVACDDAFVYHKGAASFGRWRERYLKNRKIFDQRWAWLYDRVYKEFLRKRPLHYLRLALTENLNEFRFSSVPIIELLGLVRHTWQRAGIKGLITKAHTIPSNILKTIKRIIGEPRVRSDIAMFDASAKHNYYVTKEYMDRISKARGLRIAFIVHELKIGGGFTSIRQLANEFILNGNTAYITSLSERPDRGIFNMYTSPIRYKNAKEMAEFFPQVDIVVATYWNTAYYLLPKIVEKNPHLKSIYFVQDFESWFYPEIDIITRKKVIDSYKNSDYRIVKSKWLQDKLAELGHDSQKIHLGLDLDIFYPRFVKRNTNKKRIVFQARPFEKRRGFANAFEVFKLLKSKRNDIEAVFFGCPDCQLRKINIPFEYSNTGVTNDLNKTAQLYCSCDIVFDPSLFQGFGRPGIEAMACGVPTVLTKVGGVTEYAKDRINTILVDPTDIYQMADAIMKVLDDSELRRKFIENGLKTAQEFSCKDEAKLHLEFYNQILAKK